jgi:DNA sulfur modification protein DndD
MVARAISAGRPDQSYDGFLERALHVGARGTAARMSVSLEFEDGDRRLGVERSWHFSAGGRHRREEEEVRLCDGPDLDFVLLPPPPDTEGYVRDFVSNRLVSQNLAGFFLLDGEHLERLAGSSVDDQIWGAVDAVLGAPELRKLAVDLRDYSRERRRALPQGVSVRADRVSEELAELEAGERSAAADVESLMARLGPLRRQREQIVHRIGSLRGDSYRTFKTVFEERERLTRSRDERRAELRNLLAGDVALALAGPTLRSRALDRIQAEDRAARWESSSAASRGRFTDFVNALRDRLPNIADEPDLKEAWDAVWAVRPSDCVDVIRHMHLGEADRRAVQEHLEGLSSVKDGAVSKLSKAVSALDEQIAECEGQIAHQRGVDDESQTLADELTVIQAAIAEAEAEHSREVKRLDDNRHLLAQKRVQSEGLLADGAAAAPTVARANRAERYADLADRLVEAALPRNFDAISTAVTSAYRAMAHKSLVQEVRIRRGAPVQLLDDQGEDVRRVDSSAGENQVFTLAVMSALAELAADFPIVMDTPLARLDTMHRRNVLAHFAGQRRQLILLTHPAELGPDERAMLEHRLAGTVHIGAPSAATELSS